MEAFTDDACLQGGITEGCQVPEHAIGWGKQVLEQRRRSGDEVRLGLYLWTAKEMNVYGNSEVLQRTASRSQMILNLESEMRSFAKHMNMPSEDSDRIVMHKLGIGRMSDLDTFTADDLSRARSVVRSMTVDAIRKQVAV